MKVDMIDYHCHLLPALDDGAADPKASLEIARILSDFGVSTVHCTPHRIRGCYDNVPSRVRQGVQILHQQLIEAGISLQLVPGTEHYLDEFLPETLPEALRVGSTDRVLVELPFRAGTELLRQMLVLFNSHGVRPLIAHPERCRAFEPPVKEHGLRGALSALFGRQQTQSLEDAEITAMQRLSCRFQGNLGSFAGVYGSEVRQRALLFLRHGIYSCLGSDAHRPEHLREMLEAGVAAVVAEVGEKSAAALLRGIDG